MALRSQRAVERLEARVCPEQKALLQRAAALAGETLTHFVVNSAQRAAEQTIREHEVLLLTPQESRQFVEALLNAPAPNAALRAATTHYLGVMAEQ
ncbi:MAG: DUF1778 domain-containing protein [Chloroflexota bacterium]